MLVHLKLLRLPRSSCADVVKRTLLSARRSYSSASQTGSQLTSCAELHDHMQKPDWHEKIRILDARWDLDDRDYLAMHQDHRICCSKFFSFEDCRDVTSPFPRMLPTSEGFTDYVTGLGISNGHHVIVYDDDPKVGAYSSPRVWWMFRVFGHDKVSVLDGGFGKWLSDGYPTVSGVYTNNESLPKPSRAFRSSFRNLFVVDFDVMKKNALSQNPVQVLDARGERRFSEGHISHSLSAPFTNLFNNTDKTMKSKEELQEYFQKNKVDLDSSMITSCGSGITAAINALALSHSTGIDAPLYDGSWSEWKVRAPQHISREKDD